MTNVIDLRQNSEEENFDRDLDQGEGEESSAPTPVRIYQEGGLSWTAPEYDLRAHGTYWYIGVGGVALLFVLFGIFAQSYFLSTLAALAYALIVVFTKRTPRQIHCVIRPEGLAIGKRRYRYSDFHSFCVMLHLGGNELSLEMHRNFSPFLRVPIGDMDPYILRAALLPYIQEEEHQDSLWDQISRAIKI